MTRGAVQPVKRAGRWSGFHQLYRDAAQRGLAQVKLSYTDLVQTFKRLDSPGGENVLPEYTRKLEDHIILSAAVQVYCAMAIEALLNFYGVSRLGEDFYKGNLEKSSMEPKLEMLLALCDGIFLSKDAELLVLLRRLSQKRNQLVHPRSRESSLNQVEPATWPDDVRKEAEFATNDMEQFFGLFSALNQDTKAAVEFFG